MTSAAPDLPESGQSGSALVDSAESGFTAGGSADGRAAGTDSVASTAGDGLLQESLRIPGDVAGLLRIAAFCLYGVFLTSVVPLFLPPRLLIPDWQLLAINTFFVASPFPLLATCCLLLGRAPDPRAATSSRLLRGRMRLAARLASVGFVLLVPLQISALWRAGIQAEIPSNRLIATLSSARAEIQSSRSLAELNTALAKLPGSPKLPANFNLPIPDFQKATIERLSQDLANQKQQQIQRIRTRRLVDAFNLAKNSVLAALLSVFFAAAAAVPIRRPALPRLKGFQPIKQLRTALEKRRSKREHFEALRRHARQQHRRSNLVKQLLQWIETGRSQSRRRAQARQLEARRRELKNGGRSQDGDRPSR